MRKTESPLRPDKRESSLASGWTVQAAPSQPQKESAAPQAGDEPRDDASEHPSVLSNGAVVLLGAFGGVFLLYTWGWFLVVKAYSDLNLITAQSSGVIGGVLQQILFWAAPLAPLFWFVTSVILARKRHTAVLGIALLIGALVLVPLPVLIGNGS
jgi:hypothetical protein